MSSTITDSQQWNVVLITCHDLGTQLGCYGWNVETPRIDEMASAGVQFNNAFCTAPQCSPSRSSVITGRYPHRNGMMGLAHRGWSLNNEDCALPWWLNEAGYETHLFGFQHETDWTHPERLGYQHVHRDDDGHGHPPARALNVADTFSDTLDDYEGDDPFFASLGFVEPHRPFRREYVPREAYDRYDQEAIDPLPYLESADNSLDDHRRDLADFRGLITSMVDPAVGTIRQAIRDNNLAEDTVVVFTTDHGESFKRAKQTCYDSGTRVSLLVEAPDRFEAGTHRDELVSTVDLFPTVLKLAGITCPDDIDGRSIHPLLDSTEYESRDRIYCEQTWHGDCKPVRAVRTARYKYIRRFRPYAERRPGAGDGAPTHAFFDLNTDPHELRNIVDPHEGVPVEYEQTFDDLQAALYRWMAETDDPVADGCLPMPAADRIDRTDDYPTYPIP